MERQVVFYPDITPVDLECFGPVVRDQNELDRGFSGYGGLYKPDRDGPNRLQIKLENLDRVYGLVYDRYHIRHRGGELIRYTDYHLWARTKYREREVFIELEAWHDTADGYAGHIRGTYSPERFLRESVNALPKQKARLEQALIEDGYDIRKSILGRRRSKVWTHPYDDEPGPRNPPTLQYLCYRTVYTNRLDYERFLPRIVGADVTEFIRIRERGNEYDGHECE